MIIRLLSGLQHPLFPCPHSFLGHNEVSMKTTLTEISYLQHYQMCLHLEVSLQFILTEIAQLPSMSFPHSGPGTSVRDRPDLPQLFSGDEHLGQPLQLCSLLLHGVPDPVHLSANTGDRPGGGFVAKQIGTHKDIILNYHTCARYTHWVKMCCASKYAASNLMNIRKGKLLLKNKGMRASTG